MRSITLDSKSLSLSVTTKADESRFSVPTIVEPGFVLKDPLADLVHFNVLYPYQYQEVNEAGKPEVKYSLVDPDPWLLAIAAVMWEGLIQGCTWDVIKAAVMQGLSTLKSEDLAPLEPFPRDGWKKSRKKVKTEIGLSWSQFSEDGEPLKKFFLGLKRDFDSKTEEERNAVLKPRSKE